MTRIIWVLGVTIFLLVGNCIAAPLDAPAHKETVQVTIKSELERARQDSFNAIEYAERTSFKLALIDPSYQNTPAKTLQSCDEQLSKLIFENNKNGAGTTAYFTGLYARFWANAIEKLETNADTSSLAKTYFVEFRKRQKLIDVDNKTLFSVVYGENNFRTTLEPILGRWIATHENQKI